jgi:hypothetical protein
MHNCYSSTTIPMKGNPNGQSTIDCQRNRFNYRDFFAFNFFRPRREKGIRRSIRGTYKNDPGIFAIDDSAGRIARHNRFRSEDLSSASLLTITSANFLAASFSMSADRGATESATSSFLITLLPYGRLSGGCGIAHR